MKYPIRIIRLIALIVLASCASVPKESVELSATVGRDIVVVYASHKEITKILFGRMKNDINDFVDDVYGPYQIGKLLEADFNDFNNNDPESLSFSIVDAAQNPTDANKQKRALTLMEFFVSFTHEDIEFYRKELLKPVLAQEKEVMDAIDRSYNQIIYANSIVIGHLASVRQVHDAQEEILNQFGVKDLRTKTAKQLSDASNTILQVLNEAEKIDVDNLDDELIKVKSQISGAFKE